MGQVNMEKRFFKYLKKQCLKKDFLHLNDSYLPTGFILKLNRFYLDKDSLWVSRLKISETEKIYYFGLEDNVPHTIIKFNKPSYKSCIKFVKEEVALLIKIDNPDVHGKIDQLFTLKYATNDKSSGYYYLILGSIGSDNLLRNIKKLIKNFIFEIKLNKNEIKILDYIEDNTSSENYVGQVKLNLKAIELKNNILKKNFDYEVSQKLQNHIFDEDKNNIFNPDFKNKFNKSDDELIDELNSCMLKIDNELTFEEIIEKINYNINNYENYIEEKIDI